MTKQEPVGYLSEGGAERLVIKKQAHEQIRNFRLFAHDVPLYTAPPQRTWVGLTDEDKESFWTADQMSPKEWDELYAAVEAKLKQKNGYAEEKNT